MRVVAFYTIAFDNNFVTASWVLRHKAFMALQADLIRILVQQFPVGGSMRAMTFCTFSAFYRSMYKLAFELLSKSIMTIKAQLPFGIRL
jgi:hypothetical protein